MQYPCQHDHVLTDCWHTWEDLQWAVVSTVLKGASGCYLRHSPTASGLTRRVLQDVGIMRHWLCLWREMLFTECGEKPMSPGCKVTELCTAESALWGVSARQGCTMICSVYIYHESVAEVLSCRKNKCLRTPAPMGTALVCTRAACPPVRVRGGPHLRVCTCMASNCWYYKTPISNMCTDINLPV